MTNKDFSEDENHHVLTQDMEYLGDNYLGKYVNIICWSFVALGLPAIYIISQNLLLGSISCLFHYFTSYSQFLMNKKTKHTVMTLRQGREFKYLIVSEEHILTMNQAISENQNRFGRLIKIINEQFKNFGFLPIILFSCNGFMVFLSQVFYPLVFRFLLHMAGQKVMASLKVTYIAAGQLSESYSDYYVWCCDIAKAKTTADKILEY